MLPLVRPTPPPSLASRPSSPPVLENIEDFLNVIWKDFFRFLVLFSFLGVGEELLLRTWLAGPAAVIYELIKRSQDWNNTVKLKLDSKLWL